MYCLVYAFFGVILGYICSFLAFFVVVIFQKVDQLFGNFLCNFLSVKLILAYPGLCKKKCIFAGLIGPRNSGPF